ncbi:MAG: electron transfer flavoprotein subunit alpha [Abditibacteriota bacterium]|nr:electron transfer flavoprotein subunit alpha [Abditibacteriota bacterium]MBP5092596.1 electron transfer flavoprotein subunit alpha [Abditibacteriota bacterium]
MSIFVTPDKCVGCGVCVGSCGNGAIEMKDNVPVFDLEKCIMCGACVQACPCEAITIDAGKSAADDLSAYKGVWVFGEQRDGKAAEVVFELIGIGRKLADDRNTDLSVVILGDNIDEAVEKIAAYPVDKIYVCKDKSLANYDAERYCKVLTEVVREYKPEILLAGATTTGRSFMSGVAINLYTGLTADCTGLAIGEDGLLQQTRPAYGGNIMATILCPYTRPQMATVRHKVFPISPKRESGAAEIINVSPKAELLTSRSEILDFIADMSEKVNIVDADIIISGGRGLGCPENFAVVRELADEIGAAVGASRAAVDAGWIPYAHQVGQTGKTVCPKLYIACGISGAVQHLAGMSSSDTIIAINKDKNAPIFDVADYGFVGDVLEILPLVVKKIKAARGL